jgi:hypothetical protein
MTPESCLGNVIVLTSCYGPMEGQCFVNIQRSMLDMCTMSGTTGSNTPFCKHICVVRGDSCSVASTTQILHQWLIWPRKFRCRFHVGYQWSHEFTTVQIYTFYNSLVNLLRTLVLLDGNNTRRNLDSSVPRYQEIREHGDFVVSSLIKCPQPVF